MVAMVPNAGPAAVLPHLTRCRRAARESRSFSISICCSSAPTDGFTADTVRHSVRRRVMLRLIKIHVLYQKVQLRIAAIVSKWQLCLLMLSCCPSYAKAFHCLLISPRLMATKLSHSHLHCCSFSFHPTVLIFKSSAQSSVEHQLGAI